MTGSPGIRRIQLGRELRRLRTRSGLSAAEAAVELDCDPSKISKLESGKQAVVHAELRILSRLYSATDVELARLIELGREARRRSTRDVPDWGRRYIGLEADAREIKSWQPELVPGLLQTDGYARATSRAADPTRAVAEVERLVEVRRERRAVLLGSDPPQLWAVINEAAIRRPVGGRDVMRVQLDRLRELSDAPSVSLQIMPYSVGAHPGMGGPFVILTLTDPDTRLVYLEGARGADYEERAREIEAYIVLFDRVCTAALDVADTRKMIEEVAGELR